MDGILCNLVDMYWHIRVTSCLYNHGRSALMMEAASWASCTRCLGKDITVNYFETQTIAYDGLRL